MGIRERRIRQKEQLRQEILDAARDLFASEGYEQFSMRRIAEKIEYSPTTIYLYFKDKDDLLHTLCEETCSTLLQHMADLKQAESDPLLLLRRVMLFYIEFGMTSPNHYKVAFSIKPVIYGTAEEFQHNDTMGRRLYNAFRDLVEACVNAQRFRSVDLDMTTQALWAAIHGLASLLITHTDFPWTDQTALAEMVVDIQIRGVSG
jgi:AcrR family transcriptional regulator